MDERAEDKQTAEKSLVKKEEEWVEKERYQPPGVQLSRDEKLSIWCDAYVTLKEKAFRQLFGYAFATEDEISCLGITRIEDERIIVDEFFLVEQESSHSGTEMDDEALANLIGELCEEGKSDKVSKLRCWAHSHPRMGCFWSVTDRDNCERMCSDWLLSIVVSDDYSVLARLDIRHPVYITIDRLPVFVEMESSDEFIDQCAKEVAAKVKSRRFYISKKKKDGGDDKDTDLTLDAMFCFTCGGWHADDDCPLDNEHLGMPLDDGAWDYYNF